MSTAYGSPSEYPQGDFFTPREHIGSLLLVRVHGMDKVQTSLGEKDAARTDIDVLDGPGAGGHFPDSLLFNLALVRLCRARLNAAGPGAMILARLGLGEGKAGQSAPFIFNDASPSDMQMADAFLNAERTRVQQAQSYQQPQQPQQSFSPPAGYPPPAPSQPPSYQVPQQPVDPPF